MDEGTGSNRHVIVGTILGARGVNGEVNVAVTSDSPGRFSTGGVLHLEGTPRTILRSYELSRGRVGLKLEGIDSRTEAQTLRGSHLTVPEEMVPPLPQGKYYHFQIVDMRVYTVEGEYLGKVAEILSTGSNDVYIVSQEGKDILIPALEEVIADVDVGKGMMTVDLPQGLRPDH